MTPVSCWCIKPPTSSVSEPKDRPWNRYSRPTPTWPGCWRHSSSSYSCSPGLAFFYGGMVGSKNVLNIMSMVMSTLAITAVLYVVIGYGLVSGPSVGGWVSSATPPISSVSPTG